jgi:hypothetical protein
MPAASRNFAATPGTLIPVHSAFGAFYPIPLAILFEMLTSLNLATGDILGADDFVNTGVAHRLVLQSDRLVFEQINKRDCTLVLSTASQAPIAECTHPGAFVKVALEIGAGKLASNDPAPQPIGPVLQFSHRMPSLPICIDHNNAISQHRIGEHHKDSFTAIRI